MESAPPTYETATLIDPWSLVAHYVPSNDLCCAALVNSRWHTIFAPHLWGNPASHFGDENDRVYLALTKFKRTLLIARLSVRSLTHTLHLPPAHAEIYNGPHADWLREVLDRLPGLQSLVVRGLVFFDHAALQALKYVKPTREANRLPSSAVELPGSSGLAFARSVPDATPSFALRLLDASRCTNLTAHGIALALGRFEFLIYLDLSFTYPAREAVVLETLRKLSGLQVLKLRGINLRDESLEILARAIGTKVRSLDVRDNRITDVGVRGLLDHCFLANPAGASGTRSPALLPYLGGEMLGIYQGEEFEGYLRSTFTKSFVSRLAIEDVPEGGITHLYISGNQVTVEGASGVVRSGRLHVFDIASVSCDPSEHLPLSRSPRHGIVRLPGVEKLKPVLSEHAAESLTFLRIDHAIVTKDGPRRLPDEIIHGRAELDDTALPPMPADAVELGGTSIRPEAAELAEAQTPRFELPGDPLQLVVTPALEPPAAGPRRGSAFAPEPIDTLAPESGSNDPLRPVSPLEGTLANASINVPQTSNGTSPTAESSLQPTSFRPRTYSSVVLERKARLAFHTNTSGNLHPATLPHLRTLMLTNVPAHTSTSEITERLKQFITLCASEARLAKQQAVLDYALPPGRSGRTSALKHAADQIFALKRIVLELAGENIHVGTVSALPWQHSARSVTDDRDSEAFWNAAESDFSFFGDDGEVEFPSLETGRLGGSQAKESANDGRLVNTEPLTEVPEPRIDTVSVLSAFRKERKLAYERTIAAGADDPEIEGYWEGAVQVIQPSKGVRADEELDYYGNTYSSGYLYR